MTSLNILSGIGHRPRLWPSGETFPGSIIRLNNLIGECLIRIKPDIVIYGGAQGFDMSLAFVAQSFGIETWLYGVAKQTQGWPKRSFYGIDTYIELYERTNLNRSKLFKENKYNERNRAMIDDSNMVLMLYYDKYERGETAYTYRYALKQQKPILNLWDLFVMDLMR
jgi:hypothetical protein